MREEQKPIIIKHKNTDIYTSEKIRNINPTKNSYVVAEELEYLIETTDEHVIISACAKINYKTKDGKKRLRKMLEQQSNALIPFIKEFEKGRKADGYETIYTLPEEIEKEIGYMPKED